MSYSLCILTPLYNRPQCIDIIYESLSGQKDLDFQWLVIDDGSLESSAEKFKSLSESAPFKIDYHYKENGGKHTALNFAHPYIESDFVLILDSDDYLTPDATISIREYTDKYKENEEICCFTFERGDDTKHPLVKFDEKDTLSDHIEYRINDRTKHGDCAEVIRTSVLKEFPFPVFEGERFLSEMHLWIKCAEKYKTLYIDKVIYINTYMDGGLTKSGDNMRKKCPLGCMYTQRLGLNKRCSFSHRAKKAILLVYYGSVAKKSIKEILEYSGHKAFMIPFIIPGKMYYLIKK